MSVWCSLVGAGLVSMSAALLFRGCCLFVGWYRSRRLDCSFYLLGGAGGWCGLVALWGAVVVLSAAVSSFVSSLVVSWWVEWWRHYCSFSGGMVSRLVVLGFGFFS